MLYASIVAGGALGAVGREWLSDAFPSAFPWMTLAINVAGSFLIVFALELGEYLHTHYVGFHAVGFCGGFTTFSTFSLQTLGLWQEGETGAAVLYVFLSVALCLLAVWLALKMTHRLRRPPEPVGMEEEIG
ncbi:MAG: CrcB family protein [Verrucomicrobiota bacterium]